ncbi:MAG: amphi-Trp domain-containing protein [Solidesulfovibrio sp.]|uniref:amphi-Trp domain-containing protein n=1 Tax=Solidesulfovibrio sp. TaxID=2910990 RepID=UPI002B1F60B1|nr:amphi-Trp domain-containing protein [Solidesulfovibrio sp.]MEA4858104.1 amphi-Trp domain-containing protein [Solidesulfovibrio sp.]
MEKETRFKYESVQDAQTLARYLEAVTAGFAAGELRFSSREGEVALHPGGVIGFLVEAKSMGGRMKLHLKFSWREDGGEDGDTGLTIAPGQPAAHDADE